jgi:signal peptidase II
MALARKTRIFWPVLGIWLLADCTTKELAETHLVPHISEPVLGDTLRWTLAYNTGAATGISLGAYSRPFFSLAAVVAVILLANLYRKTDSKATLTLLALGLVVAGALGNLYDRLRSSRGVVDFIDIGIGSWRFWIFNVADIGVFCGAILLAWQLSKSSSAGESEPSRSAP